MRIANPSLTLADEAMRVCAVKIGQSRECPQMCDSAPIAGKGICKADGVRHTLLRMAQQADML